MCWLILMVAISKQQCAIFRSLDSCRMVAAQEFRRCGNTCANVVKTRHWACLSGPSFPFDPAHIRSLDIPFSTRKQPQIYMCFRGFPQRLLKELEVSRHPRTSRAKTFLNAGAKASPRSKLRKVWIQGEKGREPKEMDPHAGSGVVSTCRARHGLALDHSSS